MKSWRVCELTWHVVHFSTPSQYFLLYPMSFFLFIYNKNVCMHSVLHLKTFGLGMALLFFPKQGNLLSSYESWMPVSGIPHGLQQRSCIYEQGEEHAQPDPAPLDERRRSGTKWQTACGQHLAVRPLWSAHNCTPSAPRESQWAPWATSPAEKLWSSSSHEAGSLSANASRTQPQVFT